MLFIIDMIMISSLLFTIFCVILAIRDILDAFLSKRLFKKQIELFERQKELMFWNLKR